MMTASKDALEALLAKIGAADADTRHEYHEALAQLIEAFDMAGSPVSADVRTLEEDLRNEAIEAQFDNLPV